ncbi:hypothetical protein PQ469_04785 [Mucilaginibacter sp. KACC 22773]|jgi:hypothetical protein|uniref:hypothetical protein n=1 Tax=Mucilaginibacter sp. KACC 22773 TaxID=3025671 RepID=UPI0023668FCC|nr:hypothetical protein [Mucilaginibacter sp. KACC 22773]WDF79317.1 hypothetical protein PQ469_04785 [Mucilaginibacter sp. KACC 22773]
MIINYKKAKSLIFDGPEQEILHKSFDLSRETALGITIKLDDFANNTLEDLRGVISSADFEFIVKTGAFVSDGGFLNLYKGSNNLRLYYNKKGNTIIVFAYGEFQPARYMLYLEGFWTIA